MRWILLTIALLLPPSAFASVQATIRQEELQRVVASYVEARGATAGVQSEIRRLVGLADQSVPTGRITYEVLGPQQWEGWGKTSLALIIRVDDRVVRNLPLQADVAGWRTVLVAARGIERGELLREQDLALERRDMSAVRGTPLLAKEDALGKRLRGSIRQGAPLFGSSLEKPILVHAGQQVTISIETDRLTLTATGKAKGPGGLGDLIIVQNTASQKEFQARVVDNAKVQVEF